MGSWSLVVCRSLSFPKLGSMEVSMYFVAASKLHQLRFSSWLLAWNDFLVHKLVFAWLTSETFLLLKVPFFSILCLLSSNVPTTKPTTTTKRLCWQQTRIIRYLIIFRYSIFQLFQTQFHACLIKKKPTNKLWLEEIWCHGLPALDASLCSRKLWPSNASRWNQNRRNTCVQNAVFQVHLQLSNSQVKFQGFIASKKDSG